MKLKIAVTGGIGSGKSLFCRYLAEAGYPVLSADEISKQLLQNDASLKLTITETFGAESYADGVLNREYLAGKVFANAENTKIMNALVHPVVIAYSQNLLDNLLKTNPIVFYESALVFEADMVKLFDKVVLVVAPEALRIQRLAGGDSAKEAGIRSRMAKQLPDNEKRSRADVVIVNDGTEADLRKKASELVTTLLEDKYH